MKKTIHTFFLLLALSTAPLAAADEPAIGIVNFAQCLSDSKEGKQQQASFEAMQKQIKTLLEDTEKQATELSANLNDPEFVDGLTREKEDELTAKLQALGQELDRQQKQYYQVLNQANMNVLHTMQGKINEASAEVAKEQKLLLVLNKEACFFTSPTFDVTKHVIDKMDKKFAVDAAKKQQQVAKGEPSKAPAKAPQ
jgi:outer membrane protein